MKLLIITGPVFAPSLVKLAFLRSSVPIVKRVDGIKIGTLDLLRLYRYINSQYQGILPKSTYFRTIYRRFFSGDFEF